MNSLLWLVSPYPKLLHKKAIEGNTCVEVIVINLSLKFFGLAFYGEGGHKSKILLKMAQAAKERIKIEVCSAKRYEMRDAAPKGVMFILSLLTHLFGLWKLIYKAGDDKTYLV